METSELKRKQWTVYSASLLGSKHEEKKLLCQDRVCYRSSSSRQVIALADGISQQDLNVIGVEKILGILCDRFANGDVDIINGTTEEIKYDVIISIQRELEELAEQYEVEKSVFASTLLLVCIDFTNNIYCTVHLGDGIILYKPSLEYEILSYPENGLNRNQTYLTNSPNAYRYLKVMKGEIERISEIALLSDGIYEFPLSVEIMTKSLSQVRKSPYNLKKKMDDQGMIILRKEKNDEFK